MTAVNWCRLDSSACTHDGKYLLRVDAVGTIYCGHCGEVLAEGDDIITRSIIRCDGAHVTIKHDDFGLIHACHQDTVQETITELLDIGSMVTA